MCMFECDIIQLLKENEHEGMGKQGKYGGIL